MPHPGITFREVADHPDLLAWSTRHRTRPPTGLVPTYAAAAVLQQLGALPGFTAALNLTRHHDTAHSTVERCGVFCLVMHGHHAQVVLARLVRRRAGAGLLGHGARRHTGAVAVVMTCMRVRASSGATLAGIAMANFVVETYGAFHVFSAPWPALALREYLLLPTTQALIHNHRYPASTSPGSGAARRSRQGHRAP